MSYGVVRDRGGGLEISLTAGLSGRPGPGERMTQSMLGRTKRWNSSLQGIRGGQMLERGKGLTTYTCPLSPRRVFPAHRRPHRCG